MKSSKKVTRSSSKSMKKYMSGGDIKNAVEKAAGKNKLIGNKSATENMKTAPKESSTADILKNKGVKFNIPSFGKSMKKGGTVKKKK